MENILYRYMGLHITGQDMPIPQFKPFFTKDAEMVPKLILISTYVHIFSDLMVL